MHFEDNILDVSKHFDEVPYKIKCNTHRPAGRRKRLSNSGYQAVVFSMQHRHIVAAGQQACYSRRVLLRRLRGTIAYYLEKNMVKNILAVGSPAMPRGWFSFSKHREFACMTTSPMSNFTGLTE